MKAGFRFLQESLVGSETAAARQQLEPPCRLGRAQLFCQLIPSTGASDIRRESPDNIWCESLDPDLLEHDRIIGPRQHQRGSLVAGFGGALQHQARRCEICGYDKFLSSFY